MALRWVENVQFRDPIDEFLQSLLRQHDHSALKLNQNNAIISLNHRLNHFTFLSR